MSKKSIDNILNNIVQNKKIDVDKDVKKKWKNKFKHYFYIPNGEYEKLSEGKYIQYVNLNIDKYRGGLLIKIIKNKENKVVKLALRNINTHKLWHIKPQKYYIYQHSESTNFFREMLERYNFITEDEDEL